MLVFFFFFFFFFFGAAHSMREEGNAELRPVTIAFIIQP